MASDLGSKVKINALATIVGVVIGGSLAGVPGMFLSLPTIAILKIVCDRTDNLKQWGVLLGDSIPKKSPVFVALVKLKDKRTRRSKKKEVSLDMEEVDVEDER